MTATIRLDSKSPALIKVSGQFSDKAGNLNRRNLSFLRSVAGAQGLASRVTELRLFDASGLPVAFKKLSDGEYLSDGNFARWTYSVDLTPPKNRSAAAHASWFADGKGILMLADLLPRFEGNSGRSARVAFEIPANLDVGSRYVRSSETETKDGFDVSDAEEAVFYVGVGWQSGQSQDRSNPVELLVSGEWNFSMAEAAEMAREIYESYERRYGPSSIGRPMVAITKYPGVIGYGEWDAETRGRNVTIVSSDMPFRTQALQRLHEQLRHEIFHLWIPNGVSLTGNYDWFYEGFALYESLKVAVALNRIRFEDFLDTLSRAHTIDSSQSQRISLIQASAARFAGSNTQIYARGMLTAFLCDLAMLGQSKGKRSVENLLKELFEKHRKPAAPAEGSAALLALLKSNPGITAIVERYVVGADKIEWTTEISSAGLEDSDPGPLTSLLVKQKLNGRQKALLDKLGYNSWRKLSRTSK